MSLDALAPDQRAVVQLVLQQERSYDDLADLLGSSRDAVRARAHAGLARLAPGQSLSEDDRGQLSDYLLGQQGVSERERTRELIADSADARRWARAVVGELAGVSGAALVDIPDDDESEDADDEDLPDFGDRSGHGSAVTTADLDDGDDDDDLPDFGDRTASTAGPSTKEEVTAERSGGLGTPVRPTARPRPRREPHTVPARKTGPGDRPRSSKLGGMLLLAGLALLIGAVLVWAFTRGGDDPDTSASKGTATPTATATGTPEPAIQVPLTSPSKGGKAKGTLSFYVAQSGQQAAVAFVVEASAVPESKEGETYGVWLTGNKRAPRRLGYTEPVGKDGRLGASGPEEGKEAQFIKDLGNYTTLVISRETTEDAKKPGPVVLQGKLPQGS